MNKEPKRECCEKCEAFESKGEENWAYCQNSSCPCHQEEKRYIEIPPEFWRDLDGNLVDSKTYDVPTPFNVDEEFDKRFGTLRDDGISIGDNVVTDQVKSFIHEALERQREELDL